MQRDFKKMLSISLAVHLLVIVPLFIASMRGNTFIIYSPVYTVDLVSGPGRVAGKKAGSKGKNNLARKKEIESLQSKLAALKKERAVSEKEAMAELQSKVAALKARKNKEVVDSKVKELEKKAREREEAEKLMRDLKARLAALKDNRAKSRGPGEGSSGGGKSVPGGALKEEGPRISPEVRAYLNLLDLKVRESWIVPRALIGNREDLMVQVRIMIDIDGALSAIFVERGSYNTLFDESVLRAIKKASPLPVPPRTLREGKDIYEVGFRFHYFPES